MGTPLSLTGRRFGRLLVLGLAAQGNRGHRRWICECDCGRRALVQTSNLTSGTSQSCGCTWHERRDLTSQRFGRWTVLGSSASRRERWDCRCDCGTTRSVRGSTLVAGESRSCGCLQREIAAALTKETHGQSRTALYGTWNMMIQRCTNPHVERYPLYGGRGIKVCERWRNDFAAFAADMGPKPSPQHSIDRTNNDGDYEPGNCRWATRSEQQRNTRPAAPEKRSERGRQGGLASAAARTPEQRADLARRASLIPWAGQAVVPKASS